MLKKLRVGAIFALVLILIGGMVGCSSSKHDYDIYIFNGKIENGDAFNKLAEIYEKEKGVKVKVFSLGTTEATDTLRSAMNSSEKPTIFSVGAGTVEEWKYSGYALDLKDASVPELKKLAESIPESMRLQTESGENYGIPYNIEGYGLIVNKKMIGDLFGLTDTTQFIEDFKKANYEEFKYMVIAVNDYIKENKVSNIMLNGHTYKLAPNKTELTSKLNGVFSVAGAEKWTYGDHFSNYPLNTVFSSLAAAQKATDSQIQNLKVPLEKSVQALDFETSYLAGPKSALTRGADFINSTTTGYDQAVQTFADGKALFIKQGNWVYNNIKKVNSDITSSLTMLPMKLPFTDLDIKVKGLTAEKFNESIPEFVPSYYVINKKVSSEEQKKAEEFLVWLNTSDTGKKFITDEFAFVPFNAGDDTKLENPLSNDLISYKKEENILSNAFNGAPNSWGQEAYGKILQEQYFTKAKWTKADYIKVANYSIEKWKELKAD
ncbi:ABC-type sugar transport system, periplasmic component [Clostridium pasteurianum DSM 525 = ATCC 6013]|uniref:ABC-type sugar transport system, periplasmic component n=1 Tax=Clostridium pasteurianum DSM 525 = ATCC 6013 TaxID=1262449 RepID=A0A0H3JA44_CLOPA|nr:ABC transporter substrate-binding protein [Clostridium pasteurianum]AJA49228.1 ABC-type sugar transport system, periplasmic component [Clostridium pasteurianum DSM 525 = ATCC 6013]AJA53216.1 ABC-type sugar transport system, periplasmic component [Clostridium pasteurianum DSM 525 = ATCC 6013]AOZ76410.1 sugar ABC transporter substrate-binding protein [Clostridium pasteurianum DSM 525 = ATCC 6013]AOZ80207.1 sugar ABC transporter substrate-binding protein [Clostridium pasteurianum]ELP59161.1 pu